jgi:hypothetical protein
MTAHIQVRQFCNAQVPIAEFPNSGEAMTTKRLRPGPLSLEGAISWKSQSSPVFPAISRHFLAQSGRVVRPSSGLPNQESAARKPEQSTRE